MFSGRSEDNASTHSSSSSTEASTYVEPPRPKIDWSGILKQKEENDRKRLTGTLSSWIKLSHIIVSDKILIILDRRKNKKMAWFIKPSWITINTIKFVAAAHFIVDTTNFVRPVQNSKISHFSKIKELRFLKWLNIVQLEIWV